MTDQSHRVDHAAGPSPNLAEAEQHARTLAAIHIGCDSVDGTFLAFGPDKNLGRLRVWTTQPALFDGGTA